MAHEISFCDNLPPPCGGTVASWLVHLFPDLVVRVWALARDTVLCSWARHLTLTVPLSSQEHKWVLANCWGNLTNCGGVTCDKWESRPGGVEILLLLHATETRISSGSYEPVGSKASLPPLYFHWLPHKNTKIRKIFQYCW